MQIYLALFLFFTFSIDIIIKKKFTNKLQKGAVSYESFL